MLTTDLLTSRFEAALAALPLLGILRGITPEEAVPVAERLYAEGFRLIEVPLNSPCPFESVAAIRKALPADALVGAGILLTPLQVVQMQQTGGELATMLHTDPSVIRLAKESGLICMPGAASPTDAFAALAAGADALKIFPAEMVTPAAFRAIRLALPKGVHMLPVGGIGPGNMDAYRHAGADGFGVGSTLYIPGMTPEEVGMMARRLVSAWHSLQD